MWGMLLYNSKVVRRRPRSTVLHDLQRYRKTRNRWSWSTLAKSCTNFISNISAPPTPPHPPARKPWRILWRWTLDLRRVSMITYNTFHRYSNRPTPLFSVLPLEIRTSIIHPIYLNIYP